jgi:hypothetical protein
LQTFAGDAVLQNPQGWRRTRQTAQIVFLAVFLSAHANDDLQSGETAKNQKIQKLIFSEQRIQGKLRRPQLVLIKADQRPMFTPMAMQVLQGNATIVENVEQSVIDYSPYEPSFRLSGTDIVNLAP